MENPEEVLQLLERFTKLKQKEIPRELEDYLCFVARTGDTVYRWPIIKHLFREKLIHVIKDFHDNTPSIADLPICPNVDLFNYERMKRTLLERLDAFNSAPFTIQRICELLTEPRKQYTRIDKFMRAVEKNILVVSTQEPGRRRSDSENGDSLDSIVNGELEVNVDIEMDNEAFGIDSGEIVSNSASSVAAAVPATVEESTAATSADEPKPQRKASTTEPAPDGSSSMTTGEDSPPTDIAKNKEQLVAVIPASSEEAPTESPTLPSSELPPVDDTCKDDSVVPPASSSLEEKMNSPISQVASEAVAIDAVDSARPIESEHSNPEESTTTPKEQSRGAELHSATSESQGIIEKLKESQENEPVRQCSSSGDTEDQAADDGQPQAKIAKLSDDNSPTKPANIVFEVKEDLSTSGGESLEQERDEISSCSTTDSSGSSTSVDSESVPVSAAVDDTSPIETTAEASEATAANVVPEVSPEPEVNPEPAVEDKQQQLLQAEVQETNEPPVAIVAPIEVTADAEVAPPSSGAIPEEPEAEIVPTLAAAEAAAAQQQVQEKQQHDVELDPTPPSYTATDEMETASSTATMIPENVMATDDEETNAGAPDPVTPMAAEVSDATKTDDNAMDIDESSVEPMDQ